eukprot:gene26062-31469_t
MSDTTYHREKLVIATKLLKNSTVVPSNKLKELATCNSNIVIAQDNVTLVGKLTQIRRIYFQSDDLNTVGWVINEDVRNCMECAAQFGVLKRQHHCRQCGNIICHKCCQIIKIAALEALGSVRVCLSCVYNKKAAVTGEHGGAPIMAKAESAGIVAEEIRTIHPTEVISNELSDSKPSTSTLNEEPGKEEAIHAVYDAVAPVEHILDNDMSADAITEDDQQNAEDDNMQEELARTQEDLLRLQCEHDQLTKAYNQVNKRSQNNAEAALFQIKSLTSQIASLKQQAEDSRHGAAALEEAVKKRNSVIKKQKTKIASLEEQLKQSVEYSRELEEQLSSMRNAPCAQCAALQTRLTASEAQTAQLAQAVETHQARQLVVTSSEVIREDRIYMKKVSKVSQVLEHIVEAMNNDAENRHINVQQSLQTLSVQLRRLVLGDAATPAAHKALVDVEEEMVGIDSGDYNSPMRS